MEKMFGSMMQGFFDGLSDEDRRKMKECCGKMAAACPCMGEGTVKAEDMKAMMERMRAMCCGEKG